jgi:hypothetical protein
MRRIIWWGTFLILFTSTGLAVSRVAHAEDFSSLNYQVLAPVMSSGGVYATSSSFSLLSTISEFAHDIASSVSFGSNPGFAAYPFVSTPIVSATAGNALVNLTWTAATGAVGYSVSGYSVGRSSASGGPYTFTSVGNVLSSSVTSLTNGSTYYFVIRVLDPNSLTIATSSQVSATPTAPASPPPSSGGGGGGGGGGAIPPASTGVNFSGRAYPRSTITLLQDARVVASTVADANAMFQISLTNVSGGNYIYSVYSEDSAGNRSGLLSFPVSVTAGATTNITGIFISPTIDVDKSQVKQGDNIAIFGQSSPKSNITITVNSHVQLFLQAKSDAIGAYLYTLDTSPLEIGSHSAKSKAAVLGEISDFGATVGFAVGNQTIVKTKESKCNLIGDLNTDCKVNLVDFSIMAYWYQRTLSGNGTKADLNRDSKVNLIDFSILAFHWTG